MLDIQGKKTQLARGNSLWLVLGNVDIARSVDADKSQCLLEHSRTSTCISGLLKDWDKLVNWAKFLYMYVLLNDALMLIFFHVLNILWW